MSQSQRKRNKTLSQKNADDEVPESNKASMEDLVNKCVRFFITKMRSNHPIKRTDIIQNVFQEKPGRNFDTVLTATSKKLKDIYGLDIEIIDTDSSVKKYFVSNKLPYAHLIPKQHDNDLKLAITFLVLAHIFMSKDNSTDINLWKFLNEFDITPKTECEHLGNMKVFITQTLVKQHYVTIEERGGEHDDGEPKKRFKWGSRAYEVVSKMKILKFVSELYDNQNIEFWSDQYKEAHEQFAGCEVENESN